MLLPVKILGNIKNLTEAVNGHQGQETLFWCGPVFLLISNEWADGKVLKTTSKEDPKSELFKEIFNQKVLGLCTENYKALLR